MGPLMDFGTSHSQEIQTKWESIINDVLKHVKPLPRPACFVIHRRVWGKSRLITSCADRRLFPESSFIPRRYPLLRLTYIRAINSGGRILFFFFTISLSLFLILREKLSSTKVLRLKVSKQSSPQLHPTSTSTPPTPTPHTLNSHNNPLPSQPSKCTPTPPPASSLSSPPSRLVPPPSPPPTSPLPQPASAPAASPRRSRWAPK